MKTQRIMLVLLIAVITAGLFVGCDSKKKPYEEAEGMFNEGKYEEAVVAYESLGDYKDAPDRAKEASYCVAETFFNNGRYSDAAFAFKSLGDYNDAQNRYEEAQNAFSYTVAEALFNDGRYEEAAKAFEKLGDYSDASKRREEAQNALHYAEAEALFDEGKYEEAAIAFEALGDYKDASDQAAVVRERILEVNYSASIEGYQNCLEIELYLKDAAQIFERYNEEFLSYGDYRDSQEKAAECGKYQLYFEGRDLYRDGKYEQALAKLEATDVLDADALCAFISAAILLDNGDTVEALEIAADCADKAYTTLAIDEDGYIQQQYPDILSVVNSGAQIYISKYSAQMDIFAGFIENSSLGFAHTLQEYWSEQVDKGINPAKLENLPVTYALDRMVYMSYGNSLSNIRRNNMQKIVTDQGLDTYYDKANSPVDITGYGLYVHAAANEDSGRTYSGNFFNSYILNQIGSDYFVADKPENARYLAYTTVSHTWDASWEFVNSGGYAGESYHTSVRVVIKDCLTGKILFDDTQTTNVPKGFTMKNFVYYADVNFDSSKYESVIEKLFNEWE